MPNPRVRYRARECAMHFLFSLEFSGYPWEEALDRFWDMQPVRASSRQYAERLVRGVCENIAALDADIDAALENWTPERVGRVERAVLRIALHEMRNEADVPVPVAIDEAIELAKCYGSDDSPRFVNGVLDRLAKRKDEGERMKDEG